MNENTNDLKEKIYDLEMAYEEISMLIDIIKEFGEYNAELPDGAEKMHFLTSILSEKSSRYKTILSEFIPEFQKCFMD